VSHRQAGNQSLGSGAGCVAFALRRERLRAAWALVETAPLLASAAASDEEVARHLKAHPAEFSCRTPARAVRDAGAKDFGRRFPTPRSRSTTRTDAKDFETPRQVHAAHVLVVGRDGRQRAEDKARAKVADVILAPKPARTSASLPPRSPRIRAAKPRAATSAVSKGEMVPAFEAVPSPRPRRAHARARGTPFGFHAIKVLEGVRREEAAQGRGAPDPLIDWPPRPRTRPARAKPTR